ncbi:MAG: hypothetical protein OXE85_03770 [Roseovarius sp.]|nr:hypothetical protein [Roseovarius sp.]MCY4316441.1 hypothetical protein [Roseovarius sp.]
MKIEPSPYRLILALENKTIGEHVNDETQTLRFHDLPPAILNGIIAKTQHAT